MAKKNIKYVCNNCGQIYAREFGKCNNCGEFGTIEAKEERENNANINKEICSKGINYAVKVIDVKEDVRGRIITGINEFDRLMGGGLVKDSVSLFSAPAGTGKSTLLLQVGNELAIKGYKVLYATGEESASQVKSRANRILGKNISKDNLFIVSTDILEDVVESINELNINIVIIDSIQSFTLEHINGVKGGDKQSLECANILTKIAKDKNNPRCILMISQVTKDDEVKGSNALQHLVDAVIEINGEDELKMMSAKKNRFAPLELALFCHTDFGMEEVINPSMYFVTEREKDESVEGCALSVIKEGSRPIVVEIESSVAYSYTPYPSRFVQGIRKEELGVMLSILENKAGIRLNDKNVIVSVTGGLNVKEPSIKLATLISIASCAKKKGVPSKTIFIGEVGLSGIIKKVSSIESRIKEADRMGFEEIIIPNQDLRIDTSKLNIKVSKFKDVQSVISYILK